MNALLLCSGQANQRALANKISRVVKLDAIALVTGAPVRKVSAASRARRAWQRVCSVSVGLPLRRAWFGMLDYYAARYEAFPSGETVICNEVNDRAVLELVGRVRPELTIVSGTNLLQRELIDEIHKYGRIVNLHTGISPYLKGGPNCTNWCLALRQFGLIGNTVMWIDPRIDAGNIIATERTSLTGRESLAELHIAVMEHAHSLYVKCIDRFVRGQALADVPQDAFPTKRLYLSRDWGLRHMALALYNYVLYFHPGSRFLDEPGRVELVGLDGR